MTATPEQPRGATVRPEDVAWLLLFVSLAAASPRVSNAEMELLAAIAAFQIAEPRIGFFRSGSGVAGSIAIKLGLAYLLIGVTGGIASSHYPILMVPVVAAATALGAWGAFAATCAAALSYLSFLLFLDFTRLEIPPDQIREICLRLLMIATVALVTYQLAAATRDQHRQYTATAAKLEAAEAAARRGERLAALGQLTAGLAHELRNPLGTMKASAEVLAKNLPEGNDVARELAGYIGAEVDRTNTLVTRFLDFAKPLRLEKSPGDLHETLDLAAARLEKDPSSPRVGVHRNYSPDVPALAFDADLIERVFFNLLLNAAQASPEGGVVTLKTRSAEGAVEVSVIDRGGGIDPANRESIFNPFFTKKASGVGLGLAIVAKIVDEHGGKIAVESEPGQGSTFRVLLPLA